MTTFEAVGTAAPLLLETVLHTYDSKFLHQTWDAVVRQLSCALLQRVAGLRELPVSVETGIEALRTSEASDASISPTANLWRRLSTPALRKEITLAAVEFLISQLSVQQLKQLVEQVASGSEYESARKRALRKKQLIELASDAIAARFICEEPDNTPEIELPRREHSTLLNNLEAALPRPAIAITSSSKRGRSTRSKAIQGPNEFAATEGEHLTIPLEETFEDELSASSTFAEKEKNGTVVARSSKVTSSTTRSRATRASAVRARALISSCGPKNRTTRVVAPEEAHGSAAEIVQDEKDTDPTVPELPQPQKITRKRDQSSIARDVESTPAKRTRSHTKNETECPQRIVDGSGKQEKSRAPDHEMPIEADPIESQTKDADDGLPRGLSIIEMEKRFKVVELSAFLKSQGLTTTGRKADLVARLHAHLNN